jgi:hypothetical protein
MKSYPVQTSRKSVMLYATAQKTSGNYIKPLNSLDPLSINTFTSSKPITKYSKNNAASRYQAKDTKNWNGENNSA